MTTLSQERFPESPVTADRPFAERSEAGRRMMLGFRLRYANVVDDGENLRTLGRTNGYAQRGLSME